MGMAVLILGESGSGKSASLRNFAPEEVEVYEVANKPLPFRKKLKIMQSADYSVIAKGLMKAEKKSYIIDDSQYLLSFELFDRAKETGYGKFTDIAVRFRNMLKFITDQLPNDVIVYLLHHTERSEDGHIKAKTVGKMLDSQLTLEGLFTIVLLAETDGKRHWFTTQSDGFSPAKSPMEMFNENQIENDLKIVDTTIREYYGI